MTTLKDVAKLANVDVSTVSRALNNSGYVHPQTKKRIMDAVEELSYKPNLLIKGVKKGKRKNICVMIPSLFLSMFGELVQLIEEKARDYEYEIVIINTNDDPDVEEISLKKVRDSYTDGLLIVSTGQNKRLIRDINSSDLPVVQLVRNQTDHLSSVDVNYFNCAHEGVHFLRRCGCERIALINGIMEIRPFAERYRGYLKAISELGQDDLSINNDYYNMDFFKTGYNKFKELDDQYGNIDGILTANDLQAMGVLRAAKDLGYIIPEDLKIISLAGHSMGELLETKITSMEMPLDLIANKSVELLINKINSKSDYSQVEHVTFNTSLNIRETI
ncbi:LacI family DNA-binding transcriptional regulator [Peptoniphilus vaginalis]|uniref:LacI family DNA-binding transcriptional regulator n=2 Tax=Peptoniphilus vaginalis TaxID=1756987 RepID=UPI0023F98723|nr:LacI family DNA-binding transcriptional regulator [Peptoniphilus vaginalis]